jgi:hypothetical protein
MRVRVAQLYVDAKMSGFDEIVLFIKELRGWV